MPSISSPGPASGWTESRPNYAGAEFGKSSIPSFGRAADGDMTLSTTFLPTSQRNGGTGHAGGVIVGAYLSQISVTALTGTITAGQFVACAGVPDGTTVTSFSAGQTLTCNTTSGSASVSGLSSTASMSVGQFCVIANIGPCYISTITNSTTIIVTVPAGGSLATASATGTGVSFVSYGLVKMSAAATLNWQASPVSFGASPVAMKSRSVDSPTVLVASIDATNTVLSVNTNTATTTGSNYDLQAGDPCIIINAQGASGASANVGNWELCKISSISGASGPLSPLNVTLTDPLVRVYGNSSNASLANQQVFLIKLAEYGNLSIGTGGVLTADAWSGASGGLLCVMAQQITCSGTGKISGDGLGYRGTNLASGIGEGNLGGYNTTGTSGLGTGGGGGYAAVSPPAMAGATGGFAPPVPATPGAAQSGGSGGGGGGNGGGAGAGGGYNPVTPGGAGGGVSKGGGGAAGGYLTPTGNGSLGGVGGSPSPFGTAPTPASTTAPYGASGSGGSPVAAPAFATAGASVGAVAVPQIFMGGAGGTCGAGGTGGVGGNPQSAPPAAPAPSVPIYVGSSGGAGGAGGGWSSGLKGGSGGGIVMLFARSAASLNVTSLGLQGSAGQVGFNGANGVSPSNAPGSGTFAGCGGGGGGGGGGGACGSGASGTIYVFAQSIVTTNTLTVSAVGGASGATGGSGGATAQSAAPPTGSTYPNASVNYGGGGVNGSFGGAGASGRVKVVYATLDGVYAGASADGAGLIPTAPSSPTPVGYKQTL